MDSILFADESGTSEGEPCYAIGVLSVPEQSLERFNAEFERLVHVHGVVGEVRWKKVGNSHGLMNTGLDLLALILRSDLTFNAIVVLKSAYKKWNGGDREGAFYTTYSLLLKHALKNRAGRNTVYIDHRDDSYKKHDEAVQIITTRMLARISAKADLTKVTKANSKMYPGIQAADFLTGAIKAAHHLYLDGNCKLSDGKQLLLPRMAALVGWDALQYDTWPNDRFNIWHFPEQEYRAKPTTREVVIGTSPSYICGQDLA